MPAYKKITCFTSEEEVTEIRDALDTMAQSENFNTQPSYSANADRYPDNLIPFADKHMNYLMAHKGLDPHQYVSNLRLMTRIKQPNL